MEIIKKSLLGLVLLLVVVVVWVGFSIYFQSTSVDVNPNASSYSGQIRNTFDLDELEIITERTEKSFPVSPDEFLSLIGRD
jgi:ABC-type lipoprotein release transport system permease subunit